MVACSLPDHVDDARASKHSPVRCSFVMSTACPQATSLLLAAAAHNRHRRGRRRRSATHLRTVPPPSLVLLLLVTWLQAPSPLHAAAAQDDAAAAAAALDASALVSARDGEGATPLHWAADRGSLKVWFERHRFRKC